MTARDPLSPQWEDCKVCGGDHWTKDHPRHYAKSVRLEGRSEADLTEIAMWTADLRGERIAELEEALRVERQRIGDIPRLAQALAMADKVGTSNWRKSEPQLKWARDVADAYASLEPTWKSLPTAPSE